MSPTASADIIDSAESIRALVGTIEAMAPKPGLFVDLEGVKLSRHGLIAIMQILVPPSPTVHLIDVHALQREAFETPGPGGETLRSLLESTQHPKVFFDLRRDSDALYSHFGIKLHCVVDLQLVEFATRPMRGRFLKGLATCIAEQTGRLGYSQSREWQSVKKAGKRLFDPEQGGTYEVFLERPLPTAIRDYCVQDVVVMPKLLFIYATKLKPHLGSQVHSETLWRVRLSQSPGFNPNGPHMSLGPNFTWMRLVSRCVPFDVVGPLPVS